MMMHHWNGGAYFQTDIVGDFELYSFGDGSKPWYLVNPKIAGKWMFIPLKMYL
jgi:hypothetical protein